MSDKLTNTTDLTDIKSSRIIGTVLKKFNGLMSLLTLLVLQTLSIVTLLEHRGLLTFNGLVN